MGQSLTQIAQTLKDNAKKVQLIYAFNGVGKTRLSREFKKSFAPETSEDSEVEGESKTKILYYNALTEDLFYWKNSDVEHKLLIQPNTFTDWIIRDRGQDQNIINNFQRYTDDKLNPFFIEQKKLVNESGRSRNISYYPEVSFSFLRGTERYDNVKVSKAEERCFIWSVFYSLLVEVVEMLKDSKENREDGFFNDLEYVFIDDPVTSLDDNHLIELAVDIANLVKTSESDLKFIITTHNPLFYNVISNELNNKQPNKNKNIVTQAGVVKKWIYKPEQSIKYRLDKQNDGNYVLTELDRKTPFSYHLNLLSELQEASVNEQIKKYHFSFLRNILEKTAIFLGHTKWEKLLPKMADGSPDPFANRILNLSSHSAHAGEEIAEVQENDKIKFSELIKFLETEYKFSNLNQSNDNI